MKDVVIVGGVRTPVGSFGGSLKGVSVVDLGFYCDEGSFKTFGTASGCRRKFRA